VHAFQPNLAERRQSVLLRLHRYCRSSSLLYCLPAMFLSTASHTGKCAAQAIPQKQRCAPSVPLSLMSTSRSENNRSAFAWSSSIRRPPQLRVWSFCPPTAASRTELQMCPYLVKLEGSRINSGGIVWRDVGCMSSYCRDCIRSVRRQTAERDGAGYSNCFLS
jgi:hypothetical protein